MAHELARAAVENGADVVLACGGDGTINEVINGLAGSPVPFGILPGGTANILARELRLPLSPVRAARQFMRWAPHRIALGRAHWGEAPAAPAAPARPGHSPQLMPSPPCARYFTSVAGVGYDAQVVYKLSNWLKIHLGVTGYVLEALRQLLQYSFPEFSVRLNGVSGRAPLR